MSNSLWCDKGNHAFSANDEDRQHFTKTELVKFHTGNSYGKPTYQDRQEVTEELDICGPCWKRGNDFALAPADTGNSPKSNTPTLADLEAEDEDYRRGYDAAMERVIAGMGK